MRRRSTPKTSPPLLKGDKGGVSSLLKDKFLIGKYEGNKWGGKYLRAPDIFFTILEKGGRYKFFEYNGEGIIVEDVTDSLEDLS